MKQISASHTIMGHYGRRSRGNKASKTMQQREETAGRHTHDSSRNQPIKLGLICKVGSEEPQRRKSRFLCGTSRAAR